MFASFLPPPLPIHLFLCTLLPLKFIIQSLIIMVLHVKLSEAPYFVLVFRTGHLGLDNLCRIDPWRKQIPTFSVTIGCLQLVTLWKSFVKFPPFPLERQWLSLCRSCLRVTLLRFSWYRFMVKCRGHHQAVGILVFGLL